jgi:tryptophan synthase beta chain
MAMISGFPAYCNNSGATDTLPTLDFVFLDLFGRKHLHCLRIFVEIGQPKGHAMSEQIKAEACPTLTRAKYRYDSGDVAMMTPLLPMHSPGHTFVPPPMVSHAMQEGHIGATAIGQTECYEAAVQFARTEGFIPAPETSHAIAQTIREAKRATEEGKEKTILMNWSGHGLMDLKGYEAYLDGTLQDYPLPDELLEKSQASMDGLPMP